MKGFGCRMDHARNILLKIHAVPNRMENVLVNGPLVLTEAAPTHSNASCKALLSERSGKALPNQPGTFSSAAKAAVSEPVLVGTAPSEKVSPLCRAKTAEAQRGNEFSKP